MQSNNSRNKTICAHRAHPQEGGRIEAPFSRSENAERTRNAVTKRNRALSDGAAGQTPAQQVPQSGRPPGQCVPARRPAVLQHRVYRR